MSHSQYTTIIAYRTTPLCHLVLDLRRVAGLVVFGVESVSGFFLSGL